MNNAFNLPPAKFRAIQALSTADLSIVRRSIGDCSMDDDAVREALAQYVADGGDVDDFFEISDTEPFAYQSTDSDHGLPPMGY